MQKVLATMNLFNREKDEFTPWATFLILLLLLGSTVLRASGEMVREGLVACAIESAHSNLWSHFISPEGILRDYVGELPTPEDCKLGKPNAIGWWSPIENGPMFTGLYLPAVCERARRSGAPSDQEQAHRLAQGLLTCASVSDVPGFIARGVGTDGRCHYPLGSEDQTLPWFYGLHTYVKSGLAEKPEMKQIVDKMREVAHVLDKADWRCPCDGAFKGQFRGDFKRGLPFRAAAHYLFILRAMYDVTGEHEWLDRYQKACTEEQSGTGKTRLAICAEGYAADIPRLKNLEPGLLWIYVGAQGALVKLAEMEKDESICAYYRTGLTHNAERVSRFIDAYRRFDNQNTLPFAYANWRAGYTWEPQKTQGDAGRVAASGNKKILGNRKGYERSSVTAPLSATTIAALGGGGPSGRDLILQAICHYDYTKINLCEFFLAECAYYALPSLPTPP